MVATGLVTGSAGLPKPNVQCRSASLFAVRRWGACECTGHAGPTIRTEGAGMASARTTTIVNGKRGAHDRSGAAGVSASGGPEKAVAFLANFASKSTAMLGLQAVLLLFRCACVCGYQTMWYPQKDYAERQLSYHDEQHHETVTAMTRTAPNGPPIRRDHATSRALCASIS